MKPNRFFLFSLMFFLGAINFAQKTDSLSERSNRYLVAKLDSFQFDRSNPLVWVYLNAYIKNAKRKQDFETLYYGYREAIYYSIEKDKKLQYADSALTAVKKTNNRDLIADAYYSKGRTYYGFRQYKMTLDNYLKANEILTDSKDEFTKNQVMYGISVVKIYLGHYEDALDLIETPLHYFKNQKTPDGNLFYLRCLFRKGEIYQATNNSQMARKTNLLGLQESLRFKEEIQEQYFNLAIGIDDYLGGEYAEAISNIQKGMPAMAKNGYFEMEEKGHFYIAKSYLGLRQENKALSHFRQVDSLFGQNNYLPNQLRESYEWLINHYKKEKDKDQQLYYINQLLKTDQINSENNQYITYKIHKEYDTRRLMDEKENLEKRFSKGLYFSIILLAVFLFFSVYFYFRSRKTNKEKEELYKNYEEILSQKEQLTIENQKEKIVKKLSKEIPIEVTEDILKRLKAFEENKEFLNQGIDQRALAERFKTNTAYLSKVINTYKETNFNGYINRLRIVYIIDSLLKLPKYRSYSINALSKEAGFATPRHFSDAFLSETGLRPNYFLEQIKKEKSHTV